MTCAGVPGAPRYHQGTRFEVKELGEINMVSMAHLADVYRESAGQR
jgi:Fe-S oxidoreductase